MRTAFIEQLCELASEDDRIWLVCGDLGYSVLERFANAFPERYVNVGIAEQNMTGVAAGLALTGKIVYTYSIANFPVMRCLEQIRTDVCYHNLDVKVVAVGGGLAYGSQGYTHHGVEDLAVMSSLPNMTVVAPGDPVEARAAVKALANKPGPAYLRLGKAGEPVLHSAPIEFKLGRAIVVKGGQELTLISTGGMLASVLAAANRLEQEGISVRVLSMPTVHPVDREAICCAARETQKMITVEEHSWGGLGTQVAEVLATETIPCHFVPMRLRPEPVKVSGTQDYLRQTHGIATADIYECAVRALVAASPAVPVPRS